MAIHLKYFINAAGDVQLPPNDDVYFTCCPDGYDRAEANTLDEVDKLQKRLQAATYARNQSEIERDESTFSAARQQVLDSLRTKLASSCTTPYERDFIHSYLELREEKREKYRQRFTVDRAYLEMRENDKPRNPEETLGESL